MTIWKGCWWPPTIGDVKGTAWITWGALFFEERCVFVACLFGGQLGNRIFSTKDICMNSYLSTISPNKQRFCVRCSRIFRLVSLDQAVPKQQTPNSHVLHSITFCSGLLCFHGVPVHFSHTSARNCFQDQKFFRILALQYLKLVRRMLEEWPAPEWPKDLHELDPPNMCLVGGFNQPIWKIWSSNWIISPSRGENKKNI